MPPTFRYFQDWTQLSPHLQRERLFGKFAVLSIIYIYTMYIETDYGHYKIEHFEFYHECIIYAALWGNR